MQHDLPTERLGPRGPAVADAIEACVHCGFCLPSCPTYRVLGNETDSPRGRIVLMKEVLEGTLDADEAAPFVDRCLGCHGCVTACPSGVAYGDLLDAYRALPHTKPSRGRLEGLIHRLLSHVLPHPNRFRILVRLGLLARPLRTLLPGRVRSQLDLLPKRLPAARPVRTRYPARGEHRARVALLTGCAQQVLAPEIVLDTIEVLCHNGVEVLVPEGQGCCGALAWHAGQEADARRLARRNIAAFLDLAGEPIDAILTNAAGCGAATRRYDVLFAQSDLAERAGTVARQTIDVTTFLDRLGLRPPPPLPTPVTVAHHDACHLAHAQGIRRPPRSLLAAVPGLRQVEIPDGEVCCGSAGSYNLEHPEIAGQLGAAKAAAITATGADAVAAGNIGCLVQIRRHLGDGVAVRHTVSWLADAYRAGPAPTGPPDDESAEDTQTGDRGRRQDPA